MSDHIVKSINLTDKIVAMVEDGLRPFDQTISSWPSEFRAIMWESVVVVASQRAKEARKP